MLMQGGRTLYGQALGILMLDTKFPRPPGDVGNALTWPFPTHYHIIKGAHSSRIVRQQPDAALLAPFIQGARDLEAHGVRTITTSCGFLASFQQELASAVTIPVVTSALLQVPFVSRVIGPERTVAVLTLRPNLTERHWRPAGWSPTDARIIILSMPPDATFPQVYVDNDVSADSSVLESELVDFARRTVSDHPDVGAFVLECTNFMPYSQAIRRALELPVFDLYTVVMQTYLATTGEDLSPWASRGWK